MQKTREMNRKTKCKMNETCALKPLFESVRPGGAPCKSVRNPFEHYFQTASSVSSYQCSKLIVVYSAIFNEKTIENMLLCTLVGIRVRSLLRSFVRFFVHSSFSSSFARSCLFAHTTLCQSILNQHTHRHIHTHIQTDTHTSERMDEQK